MSAPDLLPDPQPAPPAVPPRVRTAVYFTALGVATVGLVVTGTVDQLLPAASDQVNGVVDALNRACLFLTGALGVAYRPTR